MIKFQSQPTNNTCLCACVAMITGKDVNDVSSKYNKKYHFGEMLTRDIFEKEGIQYKEYGSMDETMLNLDNDAVYLVSVPSLNIQGTLHVVLVVIKDRTWSVYDPNFGRTDKLSYSVDKEQGVEFGSYQVIASVEWSEIDRLYKRNAK